MHGFLRIKDSSQNSWRVFCFFLLLFLAMMEKKIKEMRNEMGT